MPDHLGIAKLFYEAPHFNKSDANTELSNTVVRMSQWQIAEVRELVDKAYQAGWKDAIRAVQNTCQG